MFVIRFLVLAFLVAYGWSMGQEPGVSLNAFGKFISLSVFVTAPALYLLPTIEAALRRHRNLASIALVNIFLGWAVIGWVIAIAWAFKKPDQATPIISATDPAGSPSTQARAFKTCPFCAEEVLSAAIKCKHCGSNLDAGHRDTPTQT